MTLLRQLSSFASKRLSERAYITLQEWVRPVLQKQRTRGGRKVDILDDGYRVTWSNGQVFHFAHAQRYGRYMHQDGLSYIFDFMLQKYQDGDVLVEDNDIVVEVGTNVGEFACAVSARASRVLGFEPDPSAVASLLRNAAIFPNVEVLPFAAAAEDGEMEFYIQTSTSDSSFVEPQEWSSKIIVPTRSLTSVMRQHGLDRIDFLKVEAEGYEPEVLRGAGPALESVRKIAVDCSPERNGEPTFDECEEIIGRVGFKTWRKISDHSMMLFGIKD